MASSVKLVFGMTCEDGKEHSFSYNYADENTDVVDVKALIAAMIANGEIFTNVPVIAVSAKIVTTTESEFDID